MSVQKKLVTVIQPEDFNELEKQLTESLLQNGYFENFEKFPEKHAW